MRILLFTACCALSLAAADDPKEIVRRALQRNAHNDEISRQYTFLQRNDVRTLDGAGAAKHRDLQTFDVPLPEGSPYRRPIARDDKPLPPQEEKKERERLQKSIEQRRNETAAQRQQRIADWDRRRNRERENLKEVPDAFDFRLTGEEQMDGVPVWVIEGTPHAGFKPKSREAAYFPKVKGRIWVAKSDYTPVKIAVETLDTISIGAFLVRLAKGGHIGVEFTRVNDEVWLPKREFSTGTGRLGLVKKIAMEQELTWSNYRKFQVESKVVSEQ